jgi:carbonic anhydrase
LSLLLLLVLAACSPAAGGPTASSPSATLSATLPPTLPVPSPAPSAIHWTYEGEEGPEHWGELSPDYELCASGTRQSPIDIARPTATDLANVVFDYRPTPLQIVNNGHTIQVNYAPGSTIEVDGKRYELLQFHFHVPSEHLIDGAASDGELHLVHRSTAGELAVVGVLLSQGASAGDNPALGSVWANLPQAPGPAESVAIEVDADALIPESRLTFRYPGSLTTPPCSEGVSWLLMTEPVGISAAQVGAFSAIIEHNNRPIQPLSDRQLLEDTTP